ncbi:MAG: 2-succinyl-5-enolpyruvyl-6-hydroxy-3-cyclohexene-1-carboxylic-acid synthase [Propionibacteriaceae bacterium]|nr:2-succinyl-5-enolpyruvyl-6-hydroxy-3-cyclohexene-1-carboxylic-acid synthase [Propionibacteriaceae bacterium]
MSKSQECANTVVAALVAQGVTDIVLCPGSRSAGLALAAEAAPVQLHVRIDERTAGFLALGLAKANRTPVAVITTSGTAVGNLLPAVMEASHSQIPLLILSADRPAWLEDFGANQTTAQSGIFANFVRWQANLDSNAPASSWSAQTTRGFGHAIGAFGEHAGPVQLNVHLAEPLVDAPPIKLPDLPRVDFRPGNRVQKVLELAPELRTVVICGDATPGTGKQARKLAETAMLPLIAEPSSNARFGSNALSCGRIILGSELANQIQRVIVFGHPTLSRGVSALLARDDVEIVVAGGSRNDPGQRAQYFADEVVIPAGDLTWLDAWKATDAAAAAKLPRTGDALTGLELASQVLAAVSGDEVLVLGSSNPIRDADLAPIPERESPLVYANRGLAGIDGTLSTAMGIALGSHKPTTLLCGDLTFIHDSNALAIGVAEPSPKLRIVVADDSGGSIFATLEYGQPQFDSVFERLFAAGVPTDLVAVAQAYQVSARRITTRAELRRALSVPVNGLEVLVVQLDRSHRATHARQLTQIAADIAVG